MRTASIIIPVALALTAAASAILRSFECVRVCLTQAGNAHSECPYTQGASACVCDKPTVIDFAVNCVHRSCPDDVAVARDWFQRTCPGTPIQGL
ncbi:hypothetical protein BOTBODRAFT_176260 [Botryobasidium botryosum FD-172 SS1]|uniref:CFEM domain-containing protein n=1 Tax=Botryobasidium botryosum (strain FD-172 SS1) TaxID=930990 RepID=A0A067MCY2_BOTB1|nr:hypothetical protein BOTBODRAFT_176260 [Botryobasidium botryosum FD-172 SS1]